MNMILLAICVILLIGVLFFSIVALNFRDKYNDLVKEIQDAEEAKNSGRTRIPITWNGKCIQIYADATPEEFMRKFGAPWKTQTHVFITGSKHLSLTYVNHSSSIGSPQFMTVWFDENYRLDTINSD